ncbi:unnamed protein product [Phyllotreta striolata]|uniref:C2H2-type domain-containing protein n=1 Tax=Phyllotreta striolata TaxID=444603 RepID=A0A9N9TXC2_PHYSR|nr:unnamed protein product [Phyllotreta striolata]
MRQRKANSVQLLPREILLQAREIYEHQCGKCGKFYKYKWNLLRHTKYECGMPPQFTSFYFNETYNVYICLQCNKGYKYLRNFQTHQKYECNQPKKFKCDVCDKGFSQQSTERVPYREFPGHRLFSFVEHSGCFVCGNCGKTFGKKMSWYVHTKYDCGTVAMTCGYANCGAAIKRKSSMKRHILKHNVSDWERKKITGGFFDPHNQRYFCGQCNKSYKHRRHLSSHIKYECRKAPTFVCPFCSRKFYQKYTLNAHCRHTHNAIV